MHPSLNNVFYAFQTLVNQLSTNFGIAFKHGGHEDGPCSSCMSYVGLELATMIAFTKNNLLFGERILKKFYKKIKIWHLLRSITLWTMWIERNDKVFNHEQWHESKVKHRIWDELIMYVKAAWERIIKHIKISSFSTMAMLHGFDQT